MNTSSEIAESSNVPHTNQEPIADHTEGEIEHETEANQETGHPSNGDETHSSGRQHLLNYINSGPMSEGHIRLYNGETRQNDPFQNICLFTPCLFVVGFTILSIGVVLYVRHKYAIVGIFLIVLGSFSAGSSMLYTLVYVFMTIMRKSGKNEEERRRNKATLYKSQIENGSNGSHRASGFDHLAEIDARKQPNGDLLEIVNEGSGLCGSTYVPPNSDAVQLNVDNLDFEIKSTQNLDVSIWRTINGDLPQSYLESFGELPRDLLSSPSLRKGLDCFGENGTRHSSRKSKKRSIFDSLRNGQAFSIKNHGKSSSQTELLDSESDENTLFHVESIGKDATEPQQAGTSYQDIDQQEEVTLVETPNRNPATPSIVVHFNRKASDSHIHTFH